MVLAMPHREGLKMAETVPNFIPLSKYLKFLQV